MSDAPALSLDPTLPLSGRLRTEDNAVLVPPSGPERPQICGAFAADGTALTESLRSGGSADQPRTALPESAAKAEQHLAGKWLFGGVISGHFGHMLCEATGRLWALNEAADVEGVVFFARPFDKVRRARRAYAQLAALLELPRMEVINQPTSVENILLADQGLGSGELLNGRPEAREFLRERLAKLPPDGSDRRFYITRSGQPARRGKVLDEQGIEGLFAAAGYEILRPEVHPLAAQVAMFRAASHVVATEGSPLHLVSFAAPAGCKVAVIKRRFGPVFAQICDSLRWFMGNPPLELDEVISVHEPRKTRNGNLFYLEPSRPAMRAALGEAGFLPPETPDWPELTEEARAAAVAQLSAEIAQPLYPTAAPSWTEADEELT